MRVENKLNESGELLMHATEFLKIVGFIKAAKSGPAETIKAIEHFGLKVESAVVNGKGISLLVNKEAAIKVLESRKEINLSSAKGENDLIRRDLRSIARALLDLYDRLGEQPHARNSISRIAEKTNGNEL